MNYKEQFCAEYKRHIKRKGGDALLDWLLDSDFFIAPASTKYHSAYEGGLAKHSLNVFYRLRDLLLAEYGCEKMTEELMESAAICGLLHDVCKAHFYTVSFRNVKNEETGKWEKQPFYAIDDQFPFGHGEKSVYILMKHMRLEAEEALAIRWHMGAFDDSANRNPLSKTFTENPLAVLLHIADLMASYLDEKEETTELKR